MNPSGNPEKVSDQTKVHKPIKINCCHSSQSHCN